MKNSYIYAQLIAGAGLQKQIDQTIEEFSEVITALSHWKRGRTGFDKVITELTHADQMIKQMRYIAEFDYPESNARYKYRGLWKILVLNSD